MGIKINLTKEQNHLYMDIDAYFVVDSIRFGNNEAGEMIVSFDFFGYTSRDAYHMNNLPVGEGLAIGGGSAYTLVNSCIYRMQAITFKASKIFGSYIPQTKAEQRDVLYEVMKERLTSYGIKFEDVLEEEQTTNNEDEVVE